MKKSQYFLLVTSVILTILFFIVGSLYKHPVENIDYSFIIYNFKHEIYYMSNKGWWMYYSNFVQTFKNYLNNSGFSNCSMNPNIPCYLVEYKNTSEFFNQQKIISEVTLCDKSYKIFLPPIKIWHCFCIELKTKSGNFSDFFCT